MSDGETLREILPKAKKQTLAKQRELQPLSEHERAILADHRKSQRGTTNYLQAAFARGSFNYQCRNCGARPQVKQERIRAAIRAGRERLEFGVDL